MVRNVICIPGTCDEEEYYNEKYPTAAHSHFFPWLSKQLKIRDIRCNILEIPNTFMPDYELWKKELERFDFDEESILIGHSCGGGFLLRYLSENKNMKLKKVILLAPWIDPFDEKENNFFDFQWDLDLFERHNIKILYSLDDSEEIQITINTIKEKYSNLNITELRDKGHFCYREIGDTFPELLEQALE